LFALYFLNNEFKQVLAEGISYFGSMWNYIDIIPSIGVLTSVGFILTEIIVKASAEEPNEGEVPDEPSETFEQAKIVIIAITTWFMWIKCLYFLRIYESTGYLIRMIIEVIVDMKNFFLVLLVAIAAFADSLLIISINSENPYATGFTDAMIYTYRIILGDFSTDELSDTKVPWLSMSLLILCTLFNMIVMLNLLIAIISETFAKVNNNS
jgi:hypothetical protein